LIEKPKKLSFNQSYILLFLYVFFLTGLFAYVIIGRIRLFSFVAALHFLIAASLLLLQNSLNKKQAAHNLCKQDYAERNNLLEIAISKEAYTVFSLQDKIENYSQLKGLMENLSMCLSLNDTASTLSKEVNKLFNHHEVAVLFYMFSPKTGELGLSSSQKGQAKANIKSKKGDIFDYYVIKTVQPLLVEDIKRDFRFDVEKIGKEEPRTIRSLMSVPLAVGTKILGVLRVDSPIENHFKTEDLRLLKTIGDLGAVAIENAQLYEEVEDLAIRDGLTGLYLRRYLLTRLSQEISRALRNQKKISFLMIDLDRFKKYNDQFGHMAGDIVLRTIAMLLSDTFKDAGDMICRYGGEEFAVLLPDCSKEDAIELAEAIRKKISSNTIILRREKTTVTVSIGVATFPEDAKIKEELIDRADQALYNAKEKGRNRVCAA